MSTPVPPLVPTAAMPLATDSDAAFDAKAFPALASLNPFGVSLEAIAAATVTNADAALAAALGGDLPAITGQALKLLRVNAGETAAEFITVASAVSDVKALTAEAEAGTGTGLMDPVLTKAAIDAQVPGLIPASGYVPYDVETSGDGLIYDHAVDGNVASIETPDFEAGFEYLVVMDDMRFTESIQGDVRLEYYRVTGAVYSSPLVIGAVEDASAEMFGAYITIPMPDFSLRARLFPIVRRSEDGAIDTVAVGGISAAADTISKIRLSPVIGSWSFGKIWMFKRAFTQ